MEISVATSYKNGKALGPGAVPIELMKAAPAILLQFLNCLTYNFLDNQYQHTLKVLSAISYKCTYLTKCTSTGESLSQPPLAASMAKF